MSPAAGGVRSEGKAATFHSCVASVCQLLGDRGQQAPSGGSRATDVVVGCSRRAESDYATEYREAVNDGDVFASDGDGDVASALWRQWSETETSGEALSVSVDGCGGVLDNNWFTEALLILIQYRRGLLHPPLARRSPIAEAAGDLDVPTTSPSTTSPSGGGDDAAVTTTTLQLRLYFNEWGLLRLRTGRNCLLGEERNMD